MDKKTMKALVVESLPNITYRVELENGKEVIAYVAGKMKRNKIKVLVGDTVHVELDPYGGKATNRIVLRENLIS